MSGADPGEADPREVNACTHWLLHRLAARGLSDYAESTLLEDEWMIYGGLPPAAAAAIDRGEPDLSGWCPVLARWAVGADNGA